MGAGGKRVASTSRRRRVAQVVVVVVWRATRESWLVHANCSDQTPFGHRPIISTIQGGGEERVVSLPGASVRGFMGRHVLSGSAA